MARRQPIEYCRGCRHLFGISGCDLLGLTGRLNFIGKSLARNRIAICKIRGFREFGAWVAKNSKSTGAWANWLEEQ